MKPLDQQLADLAVSAKKAEDAFAAARTETHDRVIARREQTRAAATAAADRVDKDLKSASTSISTQWHALQDKVSADLARLKSDFIERQVERNVHKAADLVARKEVEAAVAIDVALASIEDAKLAVLDAIIADAEAARLRETTEPTETS